MPLPKKRKDESKNDFIDRCMGDEVMNNEFSNTKQRYAICMAEWKRKKSNASEDSDPDVDARVIIY